MEANIITRITLGLLAAGLGACSTTQETMNSWLGSTDAYLMATWGAPDRKANAGGGIRILTYEDKGPNPCQMTFAVDADHRVIAASTDCR